MDQFQPQSRADTLLIAAVLAGRIDWILLALNPARAESVAGMVELAGHAGMVMIFSILIARRVLR